MSLASNPQLKEALMASTKITPKVTVVMDTKSPKKRVVRFETDDETSE